MQNESVIRNMKFSLSFLKEYRKTIDELSYMGEGGLAKATSRQRGYIHGLCKKLDIDEDTLRYDMKDITLAEASEVLEELTFYRR